MAWYTSLDNSINRLQLPSTWQKQIVDGSEGISNVIAKVLLDDLQRLNRPILFALDGYKGAKPQPFLDGLRRVLSLSGTEVVVFDVNAVFGSKEELDKIARPYEKPDDPDFGYVFSGNIEELTDSMKVKETSIAWEKLRGEKGRRTVLICHGIGAALPQWRYLFDRIAFLDVTREQIIIRSERNELLPVGEDTARGYPFKRIYYFEYPMLNRHKMQLLKDIDWYIDNCDEKNSKLVPCTLQDEFMIPCPKFGTSRIVALMTSNDRLI